MRSFTINHTYLEREGPPPVSKCILTVVIIQCTSQSSKNKARGAVTETGVNEDRKKLQIGWTFMEKPLFKPDWKENM